MEIQALWNEASKIIEACKRAWMNRAGEEELYSVLKKMLSEQPEFLNIIMFVRGSVLRNRSPLYFIGLIADACYRLSEESGEDERLFLLRLSANLKRKPCELFRGVLSGEEVVCSNGNGTNKRYPFSKLPTRLAMPLGVRSTVSRKNTRCIISTYDSLIEEAGKAENKFSENYWEEQKKLFLHLLEMFAPRLLEAAK